MLCIKMNNKKYNIHVYNVHLLGGSYKRNIE